LANHRISIDPDIYEDIRVLGALTMSTSTNTTIKYLLECYAVYCDVKGYRNYEFLQESRKMRGLNAEV
jgi:hypothetical protein